MYLTSPDAKLAARRCLRGVASALALLALGLTGARAATPAAPSAEMMAPVQALVAFMTKLPAGVHPDVFVGNDLAIVENYPPFLFRGKDAALLWEQGFRKHASEDDYTELAVKFDAPRDFGVSGDRAYFCLPTTWTGYTHGRHFEEHGAWAFIVQRSSDGWRILGYGWGETAHTEP